MSKWDGKVVAFAIIAAIGALILLLAAGVETYGAMTAKRIHLPHSVYIVGMIFGFVGFFGLSPKRAREGAEVLVASGVQIIGAIRTGRRKSDAIVPVPVQPVPVPPDPAIELRGTAPPTDMPTQRDD